MTVALLLLSFSLFANIDSIAPSDTPMVLNHALVIEAPVHSLEGLMTEKLNDFGAVKAIISDVAECLHFWHQSARMAHGNIVRALCFHYDSQF